MIIVSIKIVSIKTSATKVLIIFFANNISTIVLSFEISSLAPNNINYHLSLCYMSIT